GLAQIFGDLPRRSFRRLERNVAAETLGHDDIRGAAADAVALDEADVVELRKVHGAQQLRGLANLLAALDFLDPDVEQAYRGPIEVEQDARHGAAHHGQRHQMMRVAANGGAEVEHDRIAADRGPDRRDGRTVDAGQHVQVES